MKKRLFLGVVARRQIKHNKYPCAFDQTQWIDYNTSNCYFYSLNVHINESTLVGDIIGRRVTPDNINEFMDVLIRELHFLGFRVVDPEKEKADHTIGVVINNASMYHFIRLDEDGSWSEKECGILPHSVEFSDIDEGYFKILYLKKR